jgi:hypothetical protein
MATEINDSKYTEQRWDLILLRQEMRELQREQQHLISKSHERSLTVWELSRIDELLDEIMGLMRQFGGLKISTNSRSNRQAA